jgi:hypothetical protein
MKKGSIQFGNYLCKIARPKYFIGPPLSESFTNPNTIPNECTFKIRKDAKPKALKMSQVDFDLYRLNLPHQN